MSKTRYLVFGASGMLGRRVMERLHSQKMSGAAKVFGLTSEDCDITDETAVHDIVTKYHPDIILNCAAYTAVDKAESDAEAADKVNHIGPANIAKAAAETDALLIHVSTDYVFDGTGTEPYTEDMQTSPIGVYGQTKLDGEKAIAESGCKHVIVRTQWLYDSEGKNFFLTMLSLFGEKERLNVVNDQTGCPTYVVDLAKALVTISQNYDGQNGVYNYSCGGDCTWYDFATSIAQLAGAETRIFPVPTSEYPTPAKRPAYSVLSKDKIVETFGVKVRHWRKSLNKCYDNWERCEE